MLQCSMAYSSFASPAAWQRAMFGLTPEYCGQNAPRAIRAMRGKALQTVPLKGISTVLWVHQKLPQSTVSQVLSGPVRDTTPYRAIPFRDSIAEGGIALICLVFIGYRASIAEIPLLRVGYRTSTLHALLGGNAQKRGRGYRTQLAMLRPQKPHSAQ